jgi:16S rRNA (cytidine1402-2'-O)-methyltransferase
MEKDSFKGGLVLVATPIGNLGDLSPRASIALRDADVWFAEDTRVSTKLQSYLGLGKPMRICNEHTSPVQIEQLIGELKTGKRAALVTDGGSPSISDPGAMLADRCYEEGIEVDAIPGPSAVTTALMLSGFFAQRFAFLGFLPRKPGPMRSEFAVFADSPYTLVAFESPHRVRRLLEAAYLALGERRYAICRELSKVHQQVWRDRLPQTPSEAEVPAKGEVSVVFEGKRKPKNAD